MKMIQPISSLHKIHITLALGSVQFNKIESHKDSEWVQQPGLTEGSPHLLSCVCKVSSHLFMAWLVMDSSQWKIKAIFVHSSKRKLHGLMQLLQKEKCFLLNWTWTITPLQSNWITILVHHYNTEFLSCTPPIYNTASYNNSERSSGEILMRILMLEI